MNYKILEPIDQLEILKQYKKLESKINWLHDERDNRQCGIQYRNDEDHFLSATGKLNPAIHEKEYNILNPLFKDTIFEHIITKFNLVRSRLMWVTKKSCYSLHSDFSERLHIPIITNKDCYFLFPNAELVHLAAGFIYTVDTTKIHSFCNFSSFSRLHFLGCIYH